jgi:hypothetical protein
MKITRSAVALTLLAVALVASNGWWAWTALDAGVTAAYHEQAFAEHHQALAELLAVVPVASDPAATRESVLAAARTAARRGVEFEKDGFAWVGQLGYRFDARGRLREVRTSWSPF